MIDPTLYADIELGEADFTRAMFPPAFPQRRVKHLRLAHHWRWINDGQYRHVSAVVAELGRYWAAG